MDAEGSHSGDRNGCGDGKQWRRVKGIVGERKRCRGKGWWRGEGMAARGRDAGRAERAVPRRGTIVVSPTQLVPEVLAVWGSDFKRRDSVS